MDDTGPITALVPVDAPPMAVTIIDPATAFLPVPWAMIEEAAALISSCPGLAAPFSEPNNCRFVAYQAARWGMDPIAVATKTFFTGAGDKMRVGYEAQLIHALIESDPDMVEPLDFQFGYSDPAKKLAGFRYCKVTGIIRSATKPRSITTPTVAQIKVKNSPLWFSDPDQQLSYYGARAWARRFKPGRILGIYSRDEMDNMRNVSDGPPRVLFEEDEPAFDGIQPTDADLKQSDSKGGAEHDDRDGPPATGNNQPAGLADDRAWVEAERKRIIALANPDYVAAEGTKVLNDKRFTRVKAYAQSDANAFDRSIRNRLDELNAQ